MGFQIFTEKEINPALYKKAPLEDLKCKKHKLGKLMVDGKYYGRVKIPNPHKNEFRENKAKRLAAQLHLDPDQWNDFIKCLLKKPKYEDILRAK